MTSQIERNEDGPNRSLITPGWSAAWISMAVADGQDEAQILRDCAANIKRIDEAEETYYHCKSESRDVAYDLMSTVDCEWESTPDWYENLASAAFGADSNEEDDHAV